MTDCARLEHLEHALLPPPMLEITHPDGAGDDGFTKLLTAHVLICRRCWHVELRSYELAADKETIKVHRIVANPSSSPCEVEVPDEPKG